MSNPIFVSICTDGSVWASVTRGFSPSGKTIAATAEISSDIASQQIHTVAGSEIA